MHTLETAVGTHKYPSQNPLCRFFLLHPEGGILSYKKWELLMHIYRKSLSFRKKKIFKSYILVKRPRLGPLKGEELGSKYVVFIQYILHLPITCISGFKSSELNLSNSNFISE